MDGSWFGQVTPTTVGVFSLLATALVALFKVWPLVMAKLNEAKRDTATAADALLARYENRVASLEAAEEKCRYDLADAIRRLSELEGYMMGRGEAKQEAQLIVSAERQADAVKRRRE